MSNNTDTPAIASFLQTNSYLPYIVEFLATRDEPLCSIDDLTEYIAEQTDDDPDDIRLQLAHNHLPRLDNHGALVFNNSIHTIQQVDKNIIEGLHERFD